MQKAVDINPVAVGNTIASAVYTETDHLVNAWVSDGFSKVKEKYDVIVFAAPLPAESSEDHNMRIEENVLKRILKDLSQHLNEGGALYLHSYVDISQYLPRGLKSEIATRFNVDGNPFAIHKITVDEGHVVSAMIRQPDRVKFAEESV